MRDICLPGGSQERGKEGQNREIKRKNRGGGHTWYTFFPAICAADFWFCWGWYWARGRAGDDMTRWIRGQGGRRLATGLLSTFVRTMSHLMLYYPSLSLPLFLAQGSHVQSLVFFTSSVLGSRFLNKFSPSFSSPSFSSFSSLFCTYQLSLYSERLVFCHSTSEKVYDSKKRQNKFPCSWVRRLTTECAYLCHGIYIQPLLSAASRYIGQHSFSPLLIKKLSFLPSLLAAS